MMIKLERTRDLYPERGLSLVTYGGCLGSTYGQPGQDMFRSIKLVFLYWTWEVGFAWKRFDHNE